MFVLASASPRRRDLLLQAGFHFEVQPSSVEEIRRPGEGPVGYATRLAREKAEDVFRRRQAAAKYPDWLVVLGADTVVVCDDEIFGKPSDGQDAARMLRALSGRTHQVITGVAVASGVERPDSVELAAEVTNVTMLTLSDAEISAYIATGEPKDKAGAYAIQGYAGRWIPRIHGCYFNVVGLPLAVTANLIEAAQGRRSKQQSIASAATPANV